MKKHFIILCIIIVLGGLSSIPAQSATVAEYANGYILLDVDKDNIKAPKCYINNNFNIIDEYLAGNKIPRYLMSYKV